MSLAHGDPRQRAVPPGGEAAGGTAHRGGWWRARGRSLIGFVSGVAGGWGDDRCSSMSAALAFYAAFSLAPMLVVIIAVAGLFFGAEAVRGQLFDNIEAIVGRDGAVVVQTMVASAWKARHGGLTGLASVAAIAVGASATFSELNSALNTIWRAHPPARPMAALIRVRLTSFGLVVGTGFLIVVLLIADAAITFTTDRLLGGASLGDLVGWIQRLLSLGFLCLAFSILLKVLPDTPVRWRHAIVGAVASALLFTGGKHLFALYLAHAGTANAFGAASSLAILMMWLYFSAAVFLLGAELAAQLSGRPPPAPLAGEDRPAT